MKKGSFSLELLLLTSCATVVSDPSLSPLKPTEQPSVVLRNQHKRYISDISFQNLSTGEKAVVLLNHLFNPDSDPTLTVLMLTNATECDFVMNVQGEKSYSIMMPASQTQTLVLEKGEYELFSQVCNLKYKTKKVIWENTEVVIKIKS